MRAVRPALLVVTNLFRDQLDRYGELDVIATRWRAAFDALPEGRRSCSTPTTRWLPRWARGRSAA